MQIRCLMCVLSLLMFPGLGLSEGSGDRELAALATNLDKLIKITERPHRMEDETRKLCSAPIGVPHDPHVEFDQPAYSHVYVSRAAKEIMMSGKGVYPVGSLIVKAKLTKPQDGKVELYTVMRKMEEGFNKPVGDWEFAVIDGKSQQVLARGKIESCHQCHASYPKTDFVTRAYMHKE